MSCQRLEGRTLNSFSGRLGLRTVFLFGESGWIPYELLVAGLRGLTFQLSTAGRLNNCLGLVLDFSAIKCQNRLIETRLLSLSWSAGPSAKAASNLALSHRPYTLTAMRLLRRSVLFLMPIVHPPAGNQLPTKPETTLRRLGVK